MAVTDAGAYKAGPDRDHATAELNAELQDKGFLVTSSADVINWLLTDAVAMPHPESEPATGPIENETADAPQPTH